MTVTIDFAAAPIKEIKARCACTPADTISFAPSDLDGTEDGIYVEITQRRGDDDEETYKCTDVVLRLPDAIAVHDALGKLIQQQKEV